MKSLAPCHVGPIRHVMVDRMLVVMVHFKTSWNTRLWSRKKNKQKPHAYTPYRVLNHTQYMGAPPRHKCCNHCLPQTWFVRNIATSAVHQMMSCCNVILVLSTLLSQDAKNKCIPTQWPQLRLYL